MKNFKVIFAFAIALAGAFHVSVKEAQACGQMGCQPYFNAGAGCGMGMPCGGGGSYTSTNVSIGIGAPVGGPVVGGPVMGGPVGLPGYGPYFAGGAGTHGMMAPGALGVMRPAWFGPVGRYPKLFFRAPIRRALGLPGFTPVRQFVFGRGAIRRQTRRAALFGRCARC